jgi:folate-binding protein YgfZ
MNRSVSTRTQSQFLVTRGAEPDNQTQFPLHFGDAAKELGAFSGSAALVWGPGSSILLHEGLDALDLLHRLSTNDLLRLEPGRSAFTVLTSERGRIIDVLNIACLEPDKLLLLSESSSAKQAAEWIDRFTIIEDAVVSDVSPDVSRFALIGPSASNVTRTAFGVELNPGNVLSPDGASQGTVLVASTWGGLARVDVITPLPNAEQLWDQLMGAGAIPAGDLAFHAARISRAIPFPETELTDDFNPLEAGLKGFISFTKGCYVGQEVVARLDTYDKLQRRLVALDSDHELTVGAELMSGGKRAGIATSVSPLQLSGTRSALGYVRRGYWEDGSELHCGEATVTVRGIPESQTAD